MISVLIQTDLPEPVAPAINRWGIFAISDTTTFPLISFPVANASLEGWFLNCDKLGIMDKELKSQDLFACVRESRKIMKAKLKELTENVELFCIDDPIEITR